jgi:hypothetical protein
MVKLSRKWVDSVLEVEGAEQRAFNCSTFIKYSSCKKGTKCFVKKILHEQCHEKHVTEDKLHDTGTSIETRPRKFK